MAEATRCCCCTPTVTPTSFSVVTMGDQTFYDLGERQLSDVERLVILDRLRRYQGRRLPTAVSLGIGVRTLQMKLRGYGVPPRGIEPVPGAGITRSHP